MDTEEMYRRGAEDAARGDLHPFYYQHYYHYRRGYDAYRKRHRLPALRQALTPRAWMLIAVLVVLLGVTAFLLLRPRNESRLSSSTPQPTSAAVVIHPTVRTPIFPTATPLPTSAVPVLRAGGTARVAEQVTSLRGRREPSTSSPVETTFNAGEQVSVLEGPVEADGYTWWKIETRGVAAWSAEKADDGTVWLEPLN